MLLGVISGSTTLNQGNINFIYSLVLYICGVHCLLYCINLTATILKANTWSERSIHNSIVVIICALMITYAFVCADVLLCDWEPSELADFLENKKDEVIADRIKNGHNNKTVSLRNINIAKYGQQKSSLYDFLEANKELAAWKGVSHNAHLITEQGEPSWHKGFITAELLNALRNT